MHECTSWARYRMLGKLMHTTDTAISALNHMRASVVKSGMQLADGAG